MPAPSLRIIGTGLLSSLLITSCTSRVLEESTPAAVEKPIAMTELTAAEQAAGWKLLFNGKNFDGWRVYRGAAPAAPWIVEDGAMVLTARGGGDLVTEEEFGPFELSLEWKISSNGNSGIMYLVKETEAAQNTYNTGPEMQVLDDAGHPDGKIPSHRAGALYDFAEPLAPAAKPVGQWNQATIRFSGTSIEHWLNGQKVAESSYGDDAWRAKVAASKFRTMPLFGLASSGRIALQDHGDKVWYRNMKIRSL